MKRRFGLNLLFILLCYCSVYAQDDNIYHLDLNPEKSAEREFLMTPAEKLNHRLFKELVFPYQFNETCNALFTTIVLPVRNCQLSDTLVYEEKCPEVVKTAFRRVMPILKEQKWAKIFPELKDKKDYDIVLPFEYSFQVPGCWDTIPAKTVRWRTEQAMNARKNNEIKSYCLQPLKISRFK